MGWSLVDFYYKQGQAFKLMGHSPELMPLDSDSSIFNELIGAIGRAVASTWHMDHSLTVA